MVGKDFARHVSDLFLKDDSAVARDFDLNLAALPDLEILKGTVEILVIRIKLHDITLSNMGYKIYAGRNNLQNDRLLRLADPDDIWLHTQKYHSSHVIIVTRGGQVCDEALLFAAEVCAYYSDGQNGDKIPVDYCKRKFVKKPNKSKAGFVVYTDYKTILVKPNKHAN